jgi:signal transduction histidine kinase
MRRRSTKRWRRWVGWRATAEITGQLLAFARKQTVSPKVLDQILANLAVNARDAIGGMGTFDQAYCATHAGLVAGEFVLLAVSDDGCGMDKQTLSHLFEPFFITKGQGLKCLYMSGYAADVIAHRGVLDG